MIAFYRREDGRFPIGPGDRHAASRSTPASLAANVRVEWCGVTSSAQLTAPFTGIAFATATALVAPNDEPGATTATGLVTGYPANTQLTAGCETPRWSK